MESVVRLILTLGLFAAFAAVVVADASAIRFADALCPEAGAGGIRVCPAAVIGTPYSIKLDGAGGCGPDPNVPGSGLPYQFRVLNGALPQGISLSKDGVLSGVPVAVGTWSFWVELSDQDPPSASWCVPSKSQREFSLAVGAPPAEVGAPYALALGASASGPSTWSIASGQLPPGMSLGSADGGITGTPALDGSFPVKVMALDSQGRTKTFDLMIVVSPKLAFATRQLAKVRVGRLYSAKVKTEGGVGPAILRVRSGRFPVGVRLNVNTGVLSGKPRKAGVFKFAIEARDALGVISTQTFVLTVRGTRLTH
jgi:large repetitive protein